MMMAAPAPAYTETISAATAPRAPPANITTAVAAAKAATPNRAFIFDYLRSTPYIERCYMKAQYQTQFNPQLSLIPTPAGELAPGECLGGEDGEVGLTASATPQAAHLTGAQIGNRPDVLGTAVPAGYDASTVVSRSLFSMSPAERPPGVARSLASGRELSELEALGRKHAEEMQLLVPAIVEAIRNVMNNHDSIAKHIVRDDRFDCFNTVSAVVTSLQEYIGRLSEWCYVSPSTFIIACIFLDRMLFKYPRLLFSRQNIYKYYGVALRLANKCVDVKNISNKNYAHVIGVSNVHLNDLEAKLLMDLRFGLYVSPAEFFWYARRLVPYHPSVQRLVGRAGPTMSSINTALALANKQTNCRVWQAVQIRPAAVTAAQDTQRRRTSVAMYMAALAMGATVAGVGMGAGAGSVSGYVAAAASGYPLSMVGNNGPLQSTGTSFLGVSAGGVGGVGTNSVGPSSTAGSPSKREAGKSGGNGAFPSVTGMSPVVPLQAARLGQQVSGTFTPVTSSHQ